MNENSIHIEDKEEVKLRSKNKRLETFVKILLILSQSILIIAYLTGFIEFEGQIIYVLNFLENIINFFSYISVFWEYYLCCLIQGVIYLIFLILILKNYIASIRFWRLGTIESIGIYACNICKYCFVYYILSVAFSKVSLTLMAFLSFAICLTILITVLIVEQKIKGKITMDFLIVSPILFVIKVVAFFLVTSFAMKPILYEMLGAFGKLASIHEKLTFAENIYLIYQGVMKPTISFIFVSSLIYAATSTVSRTFKYEFLGWADESMNWKKLLIVTFIMFCIEMFFYLVFYQTNVELIIKIKEFIVEASQSTVPCFIICLATYILTVKYKPDKEKIELKATNSKQKY